MESRDLQITVVDDEPGMCLAAKRVLHGRSISFPDVPCEAVFSVTTLDSGEALMDALKERVPDIILLDCKLPGIGGMEILEELGKMKRGALTIMITAYGTLEAAVRATKLGAYDFLAKPFTPDELRVVVKKAARNLLLTEATQRLEKEKRRIRFEFISVLGHELKGPLNAIEGYLDIIRHRRVGDDAAAYDRMLDQSMARMDGMRKLITDLLDLTRIESGEKRREVVEVDVRRIADKVMENQEIEARSREISLELKAPACLILQADPTEIEIILSNLISNAIKYNKSHGTVSVTLDPDAQGMILRVKDTGIGLTEEEIPRLFAEFSRIKKKETRDIPGSGLGLSIVHKLAALYGGRVWVESVPGEGSTFSVALSQPEAAKTEEPNR